MQVINMYLIRIIMNLNRSKERESCSAVTLFLYATDLFSQKHFGGNTIEGNVL